MSKKNQASVNYYQIQKLRKQLEGELLPSDSPPPPFQDPQQHKPEESPPALEPVVLPDIPPPSDTPFGKDYIAATELARVNAMVYAAAKRSIEGLKLYEPLPVQERFHQSITPYRLVRGSNRSGKTLCAAVEVARAVTNSDPYRKYPNMGICVVVGKDQKHISKVLYPKLFLGGAFRIVRDQQTGKWRAFRPWTKEDAERRPESRPSLPLIPERFVVKEAWDKKKADIPFMIELSTGWKIYFYTSLGKPPQGSMVDLFWFDEEIVDPRWYPEMAARVVDRSGRGIWSATPQAGTDQLYELHERAEKEQHLPKRSRRIEEFVVLLEDNLHISEEAKKAFAADLDEDDVRVRIGGEFAVTSYKVYPSFSMQLHGCPPMTIPQHWSLYAYVDPGHVTCGVLFAAVPPPQEGDYIYLWHELYLHEVSAHVFAEAMHHACRDRQFEAFVIDYHMGIHTEVGSGKTVLSQYTEALQKWGVKSRQTGHGFHLANDDVKAGVLAVKELLRVRQDGTTKLKVFADCLPNFEYEIKRYHRKRVNGVVQEYPDNRKNNHLMDALRYMALHSPRWIDHSHKSDQMRGSYKHYMAKIDRQKQMRTFARVFLGPKSLEMN